MLSFIRSKYAVKDPERFFTTEHLQTDLKGRSVRGGTATLGSQMGQVVLRMVSTAILGRLLTPADYGLIGMTAVVTGFIQLFKEVGLSTATIQRPSINHKQVSTLFWINTTLGLLLSLLSIALSPTVAWFYGEPRIVGVMCALSINFFIGGLGVQHQALLKRQMRFSILARDGLISTALSIIAGVIAGLSGARYWALVVVILTKTIINTITAWIFCGWRPGLPDMKSGVGDMLRFGGNITGFKTVNYFSRNLDNILIARFWGSQALGLYVKSYELLLLPINQINNPVSSVAVPALSKLQSNPERYKSYYFKAIMLITSIGMPIVCFFFAATDQLISLLLGEKWLTIVPIFRFLAPAAFIGTFNVATGWVYQSLGKADRQFRWGILGSFINSTIFLISVHWGPNILAASYGLSRPLMALMAIHYCYRYTFLDPKDFLKCIYRQAIASIISSATILLLMHYFPQGLNNLFSLLISLTVFIFSYISIWLVMPNGKKTLLGVTSSIGELRKIKK